MGTLNKALKRIGHIFVQSLGFLGRQWCGRLLKLIGKGWKLPVILGMSVEVEAFFEKGPFWKPFFEVTKNSYEKKNNVFEDV